MVLKCQERSLASPKLGHLYVREAITEMRNKHVAVGIFTVKQFSIY